MGDVVIERIEIENFVSIKEASLELGGDIFFITGENRDEMSSVSNGSGKSLFLQAIGWALFEENPRKGLLKDDVVGSFGSYCRVCVTLSKGGQTIIVDRVRKHPERGNSISIYIDDSEDLAKHSKADSDKFIEDLLGINSKIFYYCVYADNDKEPLVSLTSAKLNSVVSDILNTQRFDTYLTRIRKMRKTATELHKESLLSRDYCIRELASCESDIKDFKKQLKDFDKEKESKVSKLKSSIEEAGTERAEYGELLNDREAKQKEFNLAKEDMDIIEQINDQILELRKSKKVVDKQYNTALSKFQHAEAELVKAQESYDNIFNNTSGACGFCGNSLQSSSSLEDHAAAFSNRRDTAKADLIDAEVNLKVASQKVEDVDNEIIEAEKLLEANRDKLKHFQKLERTLATFDQVQKSLEFCDRTLTKLTREMKEAKDLSPVAINQNLDKRIKRKVELDKEVEDLTERVSEYEKEVEACKLLEDNIATTKAGLFNSFILELQERINANFQEMTEGDYDCSFENRNEELMMVFTNTSKSGKYFPYWIFSRGERVKITKAAAFALNDMMGIGLMIDDEGIEGVDDGGGTALLDFIISKSDGKSLFFVSHKDSIKDYFKGFTNIHITKQQGESSIVAKRIGE